ncbi:unnamed protein product [Heterosigma akashiwo]
MSILRLVSLLMLLAFAVASSPVFRAGSKSLALSTTSLNKLAVRGGVVESNRLLPAFEKARAEKKSALVSYLTAGYPAMEDTVELMLALQAGGTDVIELGVPFTDPQADGATIQHTNEIALANKITTKDSLEFGRQAVAGLTIPVVLMGYYNPFLRYGLDKLMQECKEVGVDGFIIVDLPPEYGEEIINKCREYGLSFVPLISPTTTDERIAFLADAADSFLYCVSLTGVTGARSGLPDDLPDFVARIRGVTDMPLAVGFGISQPEHVAQVSKLADGVVVGSAIMNTIDGCAAGSSAQEKAAALEAFVGTLNWRTGFSSLPLCPQHTQRFSVRTYFGDDAQTGFGGRYIPETLAEAHVELEKASSLTKRQYGVAKADPAFQAEVDFYRREFVGGPTPMYHAERLSKHCGGAQIWLKREELAHTGAHKINNAVGQALLVKRMGKTRVIAETGAGQHGVATAAVCAHMGLPCVVYMGAVDCERQALNVFRMKMLGADVRPVFAGQRTLKDAINEAMRDWVTNVRDTHYLIGSAIGPHPFPTIVRDFQAVIGKEARQQILEKAGRLPDVVVACVGGGSNAIGMFHPFVEDKEGAASGRVKRQQTLNKALGHADHGQPGVLPRPQHCVVIRATRGRSRAHSISAGLDYPGVGPEHAYLKDIGRAEYCAVTDEQVLEGFQTLSRCEGIIPALEPSHAVYQAMQLAKTMRPDQIVLVNLCGRGDKDMHTVAKAYNVDLSDYTTVANVEDYKGYFSGDGDQ